jgi:hypothetical protein
LHQHKLLVATVVVLLKHLALALVQAQAQALLAQLALALVV